jgi:hypothetical protein
MDKTINMELRCNGIEETLEKANLLKETLLEVKQLLDSLHNSDNCAEKEKEILRQQLELLAERSERACTDQGIAEISRSMVLIYQTIMQTH